MKRTLKGERRREDQEEEIWRRGGEGEKEDEKEMKMGEKEKGRMKKNGRKKKIRRRMRRKAGEGVKMDTKVLVAEGVEEEDKIRRKVKG